MTAEKSEPTTQTAAIDNGRSPVKLTFLAQAAAAQHALTPVQAMRVYWRAFFWCIFMCMGALLWGYDGQTGGALLSVPQFRADFGYIWEGSPVLPASWQTAFNSITAVGAMLGSLSVGWISDQLGRRGVIMVASLISIVGVLIQFLTPTHTNGMLLVGKLINGFALGLYLSCASAYCVEVSPLPLRGITTATVNFWSFVGVFISSCVIRGTGNWTDAYAYRLPFAIQWIFPVILLVGLPFAPESPWWLVRKGRYEDAERVLILLGGPTIDAKLQRDQIQETIELEDMHATTSTYMDCFKSENRKRTVIAMMVYVFVQCTGIVFVLSYSTYFFELAGLGTNNAFNISIGGTAIGLVGNMLTFYTVNRFGRRFLFNWGMFTCGTILFLIGFVWIGNANENAKWVVASFTIIYTFVFQASIGPAGYVLYAEIPSAKLRSKTVGIGICVGALSSMLCSIIIPYLVNPDEANLGGYVGFVFGGISFAATIWSYFFVPETKGRTIDELDLLYEKGVPGRYFETYNLYDSDADKI